MNLPTTILVLDNEAQVRESTRYRLETKGYHVLVASTSAEARRILQENRVYLAIIDIRLNDDNDPNDVSGLDFAAELGSQVPKIMLTGFRTEELTRRALLGYLRQIVPAEDVIRKQDSPPALLEAVERVFSRRIYEQINFALKINFEKGIALQEFVNPLEDINVDLQEVEELFRRLFRRENSIKMYYLSPGSGGASVARVKPIYSNGLEGSPVVVKFGSIQRITKELSAYQDYVEPYVHRHSTILIGPPTLTHRLAAYKLLFVGCSVDNPQDFNNYYNSKGVTNEKLQRTIHNIFFQTSRVWYKGKRDWEIDRDGTLPDAMEKQLWGHIQLALSNLNSTLNDLLSDKPFHHIIFRRVNSQRIGVQLEREHEELCDPLNFITLYRDRLPTPVFSAITHGDLNGRNVLVDENEMAWLIDFYRTGWGPSLRDVAELECSIRFELIHSSNLPKLLAFERAILDPILFSENLQLPIQIQGDKEFERALCAIKALRQCAWEILEGESMDEYYATLLFYALKMIAWKGISSVDKQRQSTRQRHALYSAALLCNKFAPTDNIKKTRIA